MNTEQKELRELDAWIAINVNGWHKHQEPPYREGVSTDPFAAWQIGKDHMAFVKDYKPTTDPAAALQVLEKCRKKVAVVIEDNCVRTENLSIQTHTPDLCLGICFFAKQLYSLDKTTNNQR